MTIDHFYGVLGNPINHSKSPEIHQCFAGALGIDLTYDRLCLPLDQFEKSINELIAKRLKGANVTLPFKEQAFVLCDQLTDEAKLARAVNTLTFNAGGIYGHNTDGLGLVADLSKRYHYDFADKNILILGAGGAARGIIKPILDHRPRSITLSNRTVHKAVDLVRSFTEYGSIIAMEWDALGVPNLSGILCTDGHNHIACASRVMKSFDLIINATSASIEGVFPELPKGIIAANTVGYDLMYGSKPTIFMEYILREGGRNAFDGLGMLVEQAALSFEFWHGILPKTEAIYRQLR